MTGQLYLHIGPPKTATTAFQYALQNGVVDRLVYGGSRQPKTKYNQELSRRLYRQCRGKTPLSDMPDVQEAIATTLGTGASLLISEEMFLVDSGSARFQEKITRLKQIIGGFSPIILLCARDPLEALPSLYQELYPSLPLSQKLSFRRFLQSNQALVFNYPVLISALKGAGFDRVRVIAFKKLVNGELTFVDLFGSELGVVQSLVLPKANIGSVGNAKNERILKPIRFKFVNLPKRRLKLPVEIADKLRAGYVSVLP